VGRGADTCALGRTRFRDGSRGTVGMIDTPMDFWRIEQVYV
jgi:hypothetical protein